MIKIEYKNTTFNKEFSRVYDYNISDLESFVFNTIHRYHGNHALGHGKFICKIHRLKGLPKSYIEESKEKLNREITALEKRIEQLKLQLHEISDTTPNEEIITTEVISGGGLPPKEEIIKNYCHGDLELFNKNYKKYY